MPVVNDYTVVG